MYIFIYLPVVEGRRSAPLQDGANLPPSQRHKFGFTHRPFPHLLQRAEIKKYLLIINLDYLYHATDMS